MNLNEKHIFLSGFMGAGKSRIGPLLAGKMKRQFFDVDHIIEQRTNKTIDRIFAEDGEDDFRMMEEITIREMSRKEQKAVIALGGGAVVSKANREILRQSGLVIYLKSAPEEILKRVQHKQTRPLLRDASGPDEMLERITNLLDMRQNDYEQAHIVFNRDGLEADEVAAGLLNLIEGYKGT